MEKFVKLMHVTCANLISKRELWKNFTPGTLIKSLAHNAKKQEVEGAWLLVFFDYVSSRACEKQATSGYIRPRWRTLVIHKGKV